MLIDDTARILPALREIHGVEVATKWPKDAAKGPVVLVTLAGDRGTDYRDNKVYLNELEYYVRVFAQNGEVMRETAKAVHAAMEELGYTITFRYEEGGDGMRQTALRYKMTM